MLTLVQAKDCPGKIVKKISFGIYDGAVVIFEDGTFLWLKAEVEDGDISIYDRGLFNLNDREWERPAPTETAIQLGIYTREELDQAREVCQEKAQQWQEEKDRKLYEKLKARFEPQAVISKNDEETPHA